MKKYTILLALMTSLLTSIIIISQTIPQTINYQGVLKDAAGVIVANGDYNITFKLYNVETSGSALWTETKLINVVDGIMNTQLGSVTPIGIPFDTQYWLGVTVASGGELTPRIKLSSVPYSLMSMNVPNGTITAEKIADGQVVRSLNDLNDLVYISATGGATVTTVNDTIVINAGSGSGGTGIQGVQNTNSTLDITNPNGPTATINVKLPLSLNGEVNNNIFPRGIFQGTNSGTGASFYGLQTGTGYSLRGRTIGTGGAGYFEIDNEANTNICLQTRNNGTGSSIYSYNNGTGMAGHFHIDNPLSNNTGLRTETNGTGVSFYSYNTGTGMAGHFQINNTSNSSYVLRAETNGIGRAGYFGINNTSNIYPVIYVETNGTGECISLKKTGNGPGDAVEVINTGTNTRAGIFRLDNASNSADALTVWTYGAGDAILGVANGSGAGISGLCGTSTGRAGWFETSNATNGNVALLGKTSGLGRAGWFEITNSSNVNTALVGVTNGSGHGVYGSTYLGHGVYGNSTSGNGVRGVSETRGIVGIATALSPGTETIGVLGQVDGNPENSNKWGLFANGRFGATYTKLAVVPIGVTNPNDTEQRKTASEWRGLYCQESTEIWFEDFGYGTLNNGSVTIQLDEIFSQTVNTRIPYHVFITPYGESKPLYITNKTEKSFTVVESNGGNSSIEFSYRIVAKRLGFENQRLEKLQPPPTVSLDNEKLKPEEYTRPDKLLELEKLDKSNDPGQ